MRWKKIGYSLPYNTYLEFKKTKTDVEFLVQNLQHSRWMATAKESASERYIQCLSPPDHRSSSSL